MIVNLNGATFIASRENENLSYILKLRSFLSILQPDAASAISFDSSIGSNTTPFNTNCLTNLAK